MSAKSSCTSPPLRHPALLTPSHQWLVIPHFCPTRKELPASPGFVCFPLCREPCGVLPSSEPLSLLHPAHPCPHLSFRLGKKSLRYQKQGSRRRFFSATLHHLSSPVIPQWRLPVFELCQPRYFCLEWKENGRKIPWLLLQTISQIYLLFSFSQEQNHTKPAKQADKSHIAAQWGYDSMCLAPWGWQAEQTDISPWKTPFGSQ